MLTAFNREMLENQNSYTDHTAAYMGEVTHLKPAKGQGKVPSRTAHPSWASEFPVKNLVVDTASS